MTTIEETIWKWTGNNIASFTGSVVPTPTKASTCTFYMWGILLIAHSFSWFRAPLTLVKYWVMRPSLALYSLWICPTMSWESLQILILEAERASARFSLDRMASYSVSLLDVGNPSRMACSSCSPIGDRRRGPILNPEVQEALSTKRIHHPSLPGSLSWEGCWGISAIKSTMTCPFMDNLG